jgi:hypothetical protein
MRVANATHLEAGWVMSRLAPDFDLLDVWELPASGGREDFGALLEVLAELDPTSGGSPASDLLFAVRLHLGRLLGWDHAEERPIPGCTETSLADRLPAELRGSAATPVISPAMREKAGGFTPVFRTDDEWAAEISNATVHGVLQLCWVPLQDGRYGGRLAVWVKPRGALGRAYLLLIAPFRHLVVYPALLKRVGEAWAASGGGRLPQR